MICELAEGRYLLLDEKVESILAAYLHESERRLEAGGILIGSYRGPHVHICSCTVPLAGDLRRPTLFERVDPGHQNAALSAWRMSRGTETFVGEWHTHPEPDPEPSALDKRTWSSLLARSRQPLVFLIVGWRSSWCGLGDGSEVQRVNARGLE